MNIKSIPDSPGSPNPTAGVPAAFAPPGGQQPGRRSLSAPPVAVSAAAVRVARASADLGIDPTDLSNNQSTLLLKVDAMAPTEARNLVTRLPTAPAVLVQRSGITVERLGGPLSKLGPLLSFYGTCVQQQSAVADSRQVTGTVMRREWLHIKQAITAALPQGVPLTDEQKKLQQVWQPVADLEAKLAQAVTGKQTAGKKKAQQRAGELATAGNEQDLLNTIIDLQAGRDVDDATAAQAVATYQQQQAQSKASALEPLLSTPAKSGAARRSRR